MHFVKMALNLGFILVLIGVCAACVAPAAIKVTIMPLGDSITYGVMGNSNGNDGGYRLPLCRDLLGTAMLNYVGSQNSGPTTSTCGDNANEGHPGYRIDQIAANVVGWLTTYQPQIVLLHIGTNDVLQNYDVANMPARLGSLIDQITATDPGAMIFVAQILPIGNQAMNAEVQTYNAAIPGIVQAKDAAGEHVQMVNMYDAVPLSDLPDGVHPNDAGYALMANVWEQAMLRLFPKRHGIE